MSQNKPENQEKRGEILGMSYGKIMTSLLIPTDSRTNPKRILGGIAFLVFICFFLLAALPRSCGHDAEEQAPLQTGSLTVQPVTPRA